jgi:hypothetical protein
MSESIMIRRTLIFTGILLGLATLACGPLSSAPATEPTATVAVVATPTLAPTSTPDPAALLEPTAVVDSTADPLDPNQTPPAADPGAPTPEQPVGTDETSPEDGPTEPDPGNGEGSAESPSAGCPAGGQNLLANPSFEGEYKSFGAFKELNHAPFWFPWWVDGQNNLRPEFKPAEIATAPNRVHSGNSAQQYFKSFGQFKSGLFQSVLDVPAGARLQFSVFGQAWSCEEFDMCPDGSSVNPADMLMRVGIDPTGDTNYSAETVVWSAYFNPLDHWEVACVEAVSERDIVTVFLWASPNGPRQNQDVYWDDASLIVIP